MAREEHIHIITAGENIHAAYTAAIRDLADITHTYVFADTELYTNSARDDERTKAYKTAARDAANKVKSVCLSLKIPASLIYIDPPAFGSVIKAILKIRKEHPDAKYSFNLSAGSKDLSMALFAISLWLEGDAYYAFSDRTGDAAPVKMAIPKIPARDMWANPNYIKILAILDPAPGEKEPTPLPRQYIFTQLESFYMPVRKKGVKTVTSPTKTDLFTGKRAVIPVLSQGTFSNLLSAMIAYNLIREAAVPDGNRKEKYYAITPGGELALKFS